MLKINSVDVRQDRGGECEGVEEGKEEKVSSCKFDNIIILYLHIYNRVRQVFCFKLKIEAVLKNYKLQGFFWGPGYQSVQKITKYSGQSN